MSVNQIKLASEVPRRSSGLPSVRVMESAGQSGAEETLRHFLKECCGLGDIMEIQGIGEVDEIEELLLFCDRNKKIEKRKKYLEDLWKERKRAGAAEVRRRDLEWHGVKKEELARPSAIAKAKLGTASDLISTVAGSRLSTTHSYPAMAETVFTVKFELPALINLF